MNESHNMILPFSLGRGLHMLNCEAGRVHYVNDWVLKIIEVFKYFALVGIQEATKAQARLNKKVKGFVFTWNSKDLSSNK